LLLLLLVIYLQYKNKENFINHGVYPDSLTHFLLEDSYPVEIQTILNEDITRTRLHKPIYNVGSYDQITNNIKYPANPDIGNCSPQEFCGAIYKDANFK
jgi:hypothetical protein